MSSVIPRTRIRALKEHELKDMIRLWSESGLPSRPKGRDSHSRLKRQWENDPDLFLGAFHGTNMVGVALLSHDGRKGWINRLAVHPDYRHRGIAAALISRSETILRKRGLHIFCAHIEADREESMRLLEKSGYSHETEIFYFTKRDSKDY